MHVNVHRFRFPEHPSLLSINMSLLLIFNYYWKVLCTSKRLKETDQQINIMSKLI